MVSSEEAPGQLPVITFTSAAVEKLTEVAASHGRPLAGFRLQIEDRKSVV